MPHDSREDLMPIRYDCPQSLCPGAYVIYDPATGVGTGYFPDGSIRWTPRNIQAEEAFHDIAVGIWVFHVSPDQRLPEGF